MTVDLDTLYGPIAADIVTAHEILREELASDHGVVAELCAHIEGYHGKQLRPAVVLLSGAACGRVTGAHHTLAAVVELVHVATLVHDDILDDAELRRRTPTVNQRFGAERALLLGDYLFSHAYHLCSSLDSQGAARLIARTAAMLCEGELMQVANRNNYELGEERYFDIIGRKTASLIAASAALGAQYAGADERLCRGMHAYGRSLGVAFQIVDDMLDLAGDEEQVGKSLGRDLEKGKPTLPLIHYLRTQGPQQREQMLELLESGGPGRCGRIAEILRESDSIAYAGHVAASHVQDALRCLEALPPSDARASLQAMAEFVLARRF